MVSGPWFALRCPLRPDTQAIDGEANGSPELQPPALFSVSSPTSVELKTKAKDKQLALALANSFLRFSQHYYFFVSLANLAFCLAHCGSTPMPHTFPTAGIPNQLVGRTPWSARDALVPPVRKESIGCDEREADQGVDADEGVRPTICATVRKREKHVALGSTPPSPRW